MSCLTEDRLIEMLDGRGLDAARPDERTHLSGCDACQDAWAAVASTADVLADARPRRARRAWLFFPLAAAAAILAVVIGLVLVRSDEPRPTPRELVAVLLDGPEADSRRAQELLAAAGPAARHALLDARRRALGSPRSRPLHDLLHAVRGRDETLRPKLESSRVTVSMKNALLSGFCRFLTEITGADIVLDPARFETLNSSPLDLDVSSTPLRDVLDLACTLLDLDYDLRYGVIFVSTPRRLWRGERGETEGVLPLVNRWSEQPLTGEDQALAGKLRSIRITMDFQAAPLAAVAAYVHEISGVPLVMDPVLGARAATLRASDLGLDHLVALMTLPFGADARIEGGVVRLGTQGSPLSENEARAAARLKTFASAQADFRANDRDGNGVHDFWTGDVAGLFGLLRSGGDRVEADMIKLIERRAALADAAPLPDDAADGRILRAGWVRTPADGYRFQAMTADASVTPKEVYAQDTQGRPNLGRCFNASRFGFCAFPAVYGVSGTMTFIVNEGNTVFMRDTGGRPVLEWPDDAALNAEWQRVD